MESGQLERDRIIFSDEKLFRCGKFQSGSGRNNRYYTRDGAKKSDIDDPLLYRESEAYGAPAMVATAVSTRGAIGPYIVETGTQIDGEYHQMCILTQFIPQMVMLFLDGFYSQEDGAPAHRKKSVRRE